MLTDKQRKKRLISDGYSELPDVFQRLEKGEHLKGYIKEVREDEKIDVSLTPLGYQKAEGVAKIILDSLKAQGRYAGSEPNLFILYFAAAKKHSNRLSGLFTNKK